MLTKENFIVDEESRHRNAVCPLMRSFRVVFGYLYPMLNVGILKLMEVAQHRG